MATTNPTPIAPDVQLPATKALGGVTADEITSVNPIKVASEWLDGFSKSLSKGDVNGVLASLAKDAWWRDLLALTWDLRSFQGQDNIKQFLSDRLQQGSISNVQLTNAAVDKLYDDLAWLRLHFSFDTPVGSGVGVARLVRIKNSDGTKWKAHHVATILETLNDFPEATGMRREFTSDHGTWADKRKEEREFKDRDPEVLVVGGGHSGLDIAARLKLMGISTLICEKNATVGDNWRNRYSALCLHDVVCKYCASLWPSRVTDVD